MIPKEAVEAGARAIYRSVNRSHADTKGWDEVKPNWQASYRRDALAALTGAAPFLRAQALEDAADELEELASDASYNDSEDAMETWLNAATNLHARAATERGQE